MEAKKLNRGYSVRVPYSDMKRGGEGKVVSTSGCSPFQVGRKLTLGVIAWRGEGVHG